jgi:hypothetical protein
MSEGSRQRPAIAGAWWMARSGTGSAARWAAVGLLLVPTLCAAAEERSAYVLGGVAAIHSQGGFSWAPIGDALAPGGTTLGWQVAAGFFVRPHASLEAEISSTGVLKVVEATRTGVMRFGTLHEERQDRFFGVNVRFYVRLGQHVHIEPVAGVGALRQTGREQLDYDPSDYGHERKRVVFPAERLGPWTDGSVSAGIDVRLGGPRLSLVPSVRARGTLRGSMWEVYDRDGRFTFAAGLSGRLSF